MLALWEPLHWRAWNVTSSKQNSQHSGYSRNTGPNTWRVYTCPEAKFSLHSLCRIREWHMQMNVHMLFSAQFRPNRSTLLKAAGAIVITHRNSSVARGGEEQEVLQVPPYTTLGSSCTLLSLPSMAPKMSGRGHLQCI